MGENVRAYMCVSVYVFNKGHPHEPIHQQIGYYTKKEKKKERKKEEENAYIFGHYVRILSIFGVQATP